MTAGGVRRDAPYKRDETALLLVDVRRVWVEPGLDRAHLDGNVTALHRRLAKVVVPNQVRLLEAGRGAGVTVVHTIIRSLTRDGRGRSLGHRLSGIHVPPGAPEGDVIAPLAPREDEIVLPKTSSGVFNSTNLDYLVGNLGVRFLIVTGIVADQRVDRAVRDGAGRGYLVTCVHDSCATYREERHGAALRAFGGYCWTAGELRAGRPLPGRAGPARRDAPARLAPRRACRARCGRAGARLVRARVPGNFKT